MTFSIDKTDVVEKSVETLKDQNHQLRHDLKDVVAHLAAMVEGLEQDSMSVELCLSEMRRLVKHSRRTIERCPD